MSDLDVTMRLRLQQDIDKEAKRAADSLKGLDKALDGLKGTHLDLDRDIGDVAAAARKAKQPVNDLVRDVKKLNAIDTSIAEREVKAIGAASIDASIDVGKIKEKIAVLNGASTDGAVAEIKAIGAASIDASVDVGKVRAKIGDLNAAVTNGATTEIKAIGTASDGVVDNIGKIKTKLGEVNGLKTDAVEAEIDAIGRAAVEAKNKLDGLKVPNSTTNGRQDHRPLMDQEVPRQSISTKLPSAIGVAWLASQVDETAKWIDSIGDQARYLEREIASVAVTAEMRDPETLARIGQSNSKLALKYGVERSQVNETRKTFAASGIGVDSQEQILDPTLRTAKASDSDPNNVAQSAIAAKQNLHLKDSEVPAFYDQLAKGTKLGSFEVDAVAKNLPKLAAAYEQTGRKGLDATSELIAFAQIARKTAGSSDDAAVNMQNLLGKIFSSDTRDSFKENGVDLEQVFKQSQANGTSYLMDVLDQMIKIAGNDPMKINEFFGDQQARNAAVAMANNRKVYDDWHNQIRNQSAGTVATDWNFVKDLPAEKKARSRQAYQQQYEDYTGKVGGLIAPVIDNIGRIINRKFNEQRFLEDVPQLDKQSAGRRAELEAELKRLEDTGDSGGTILGPRKAQIRAELQALEEENAIRKSEQERLTRENAIDPVTTNAIADKPVKASARLDDYIPQGKIPIPVDRPVSAARDIAQLDQPIEAAVGKDMSGAGAKSMDTFISAIRDGGQEAIRAAGDIANQMKSILSLTLTPTISPNMVNPGSNTTTTKSVPGKQSSISSSTTNKVTQHITSSKANAKQIARHIQREQDRAIRMARARALSDMGPMPA